VWITSSTDNDNGRCSATKRAAFPATNCATGTCAARAAATFFSALSSVPVKNRTGLPRKRAWRPNTSACTSSNACPRCGAPLTYGIAVVM